MSKNRNAGKRGCGNREEQWREERVWMVCPLLCTSHEGSSSLLDHSYRRTLCLVVSFPNAQLYSEPSPTSVGN
ncbi:hypothetical protein SISSUDRAFT_1050043 [Sistotremastrum suecicum HHB10207 ss-3]|uniref:Uncharacterized protein n=1 Tax=Sistotremastrum suecicum HHB10207 ss-3 TaxID=1314776 RepID=A0A166BGH0_9AGAM|nr:hypothetical protein SISSUDRAFT_1050043 [Sistotremastrum suecicum HHB10207 ss-3]